MQQIAENLNHTKQENNNQKYFSQNQQQDQSFMSFQENQRQQRQSLQVLNDFKTHKEEEMVMPSQPIHLQKLYQIYQINRNRKRELKKAIAKKRQEKHAINISQYDQKDSLEQYIDAQQKSQTFQNIEKTYHQRQGIIANLQKKYNQISTIYIEALAQNYENMDKLIDDHVKKNKQLFATCMTSFGIVGISKESKKRRLKVKNYIKQKDKNLSKSQSKDSQISTLKEKSIKKVEYSQQQQDDIRLTALNRSRSKSQDSEKSKKKIINYRYLIRILKFCQINLITHPQFEAAIGPYMLPYHFIDQKVKINGIHVIQQEKKKEKSLKYQQQQKDTNEYIIFYEKNIAILQVNNKQNIKQQVIPVLKICQKISFDKQVIFCASLKNKQEIMLLIGTSDGILRKYTKKVQKISQQSQSKSYKQYQIKSIFACYPTHQEIKSVSEPIKFTLIDYQTILFVWNGNKVHSLNLQSYSIKLLTQLPENVLKIDKSIIITQSVCYLNYFQQGKISLNFNNQLKKKLRKDQFIGISEIVDKSQKKRLFKYQEKAQKQNQQMKLPNKSQINLQKVSQKSNMFIIGVHQGNGNIGIKLWMQEK